ncbi:MAG: phosphoribosyltransferase [Candidatus Levyibacteriota bacterium]
MQVVDGAVLSRTLIDLCMKDEELKSKKPLLVFPGEGARVVGKYLKKMKPKLTANNEVFLPTRRTMVKSGVFNLSVDYSSLPNTLDTNTVLIIDDVVATGQTAEEVASTLKMRFPGIRCILASWLFVWPSTNENKKSPSGVNGIDKIITSIILKGNYTARPPINSISCFMRNEQRYRDVKKNFTDKYIGDKNAFQEIMEELK